jgi:hypothetical protein
MLKVINNAGRPQDVAIGTLADVPKYTKAIRPELVSVAKGLYDKGSILKSRYELLLRRSAKE